MFWARSLTHPKRMFGRKNNTFCNFIYLLLLFVFFFILGGRGHIYMSTSL